MDHATIVQLAAVPLIGAITGYVTNAIAVRMLFRPRRERRWFGLRWQGLIPKRRAQIAHTIGETISSHLISHDDIKRALDNPDVAERVRRLFDERFDGLVQQGIKQLNPMASMFLTGSAVKRVKEALMAEALAAIPDITESFTASLEETLDFKQLVVSKIEGFELDRFEQIVLRVAARELRAIEVLGGVLGFAIGLLTDLLWLL